MLKDIAVGIGAAEDATYAGDYAISVAAAFHAHPTGIAFVYEPSDAESATFYLPAAEFIASEQRESKQAAKKALDRFAASAPRSGVSADPVALVTSYAVHSALFDSARPVIIVPYIQRAPLTLDRVSVCWDGSRPAVRAIAEAMPFWSAQSPSRSSPSPMNAASRTK